MGSSTLSEVQPASYTCWLLVEYAKDSFLIQTVGMVSGCDLLLTLRFRPY